MRQPKPDAFQPPSRTPKAEEIDLSDVTPVKPRPPLPAAPDEAASERSNRTVEAPATGEQTNCSVLHELEQGVVAPTKRETQRYSFEIYVDQKQRIEDLQYLYKKRTGKKLPASRIIREALDRFLTEALD